MRLAQAIVCVITLLASLAVSSADQTQAVPATQPAGTASLIKENRILSLVCEATPIVWKGRLTLLECIRPASSKNQQDKHYLTLKDVETGKQLARFGQGYSLASAIVHDGKVHVFASLLANNAWNDVTHFESADLVTWNKNIAIHQEKEQLFNSSVCQTPDGFVMAYESNDPRYTRFTIKFARSNNLRDWKKVPDITFGPDRYAACPCIRYVDGYYYVMYLEHRLPKWFFETCLVRSKNLKDWEASPIDPLITPGPDEGINTSDPDIVEYHGRTWLYYSIGDQRSWIKLKRASYPGTLREFYESRFPNGPATRPNSSCDQKH